MSKYIDMSYQNFMADEIEYFFYKAHINVDIDVLENGNFKMKDPDERRQYGNKKRILGLFKEAFENTFDGIPELAWKLDIYNKIVAFLESDDLGFRSLEWPYEKFKNVLKQDSEQFSKDKIKWIFKFNEDDLDEALMKEFGLDSIPSDYIVSIGNGGFMLKSDYEEYKNISLDHANEFNKMANTDLNGDGFLCDMFDVELSNHEFLYTRDPEQTLDVLGYKDADFENNPILKVALNNAIKKQFYKEYVKEWKEVHKGDEFRGMRPVGFDEWLDNEYTESQNNEVER